MTVIGYYAMTVIGYERRQNCLRTELMFENGAKGVLT